MFAFGPCWNDDDLSGLSRGPKQILRGGKNGDATATPKRPQLNDLPEDKKRTAA